MARFLSTGIRNESVELFLRHCRLGIREADSVEAPCVVSITKVNERMVRVFTFLALQILHQTRISICPRFFLETDVASSKTPLSNSRAFTRRPTEE